MRIPLHGKGTTLDKLSLWADMSTMNPNGFRTVSTKKNRKPQKTHAERLAEELKNG